MVWFARRTKLRVGLSLVEAQQPVVQAPRAADGHRITRFGSLGCAQPFDAGPSVVRGLAEQNLVSFWECESMGINDYARWLSRVALVSRSIVIGWGMSVVFGQLVTSGLHVGRNLDGPSF